MKNRLSLILIFTILCMLFTGCTTTEPDELTTEQNEFEVEETTQITEEETEIMSETVSETEEEIADLPEWKGEQPKRQTVGSVFLGAQELTDFDVLF